MDEHVGTPMDGENITSKVTSTTDKKIKKQVTKIPPIVLLS